MDALTQPVPIEQAIRRIGDKTPVTSVLRTEDWSRVPLALRERAMFSAGVDWADFLESSQAKLLKAVSGIREDVGRGKQAFVDRGSFIGDMRKLVLAQGKSDESGGLTDLASRARLGLIYDVQTQQAFGYARWKFDQDPDALNAFPAQELLREEARRVPRDWETRWRNAGGRLVQGRMAALKTDPVWQQLSRFGTPYPPFDFGSGMGLRDLDRAESEQLGLIEPERDLEPQEQDFNAQLEGSARNVSPNMRAALARVFGAQIDVTGDKVRWTGRGA